MAEELAVIDVTADLVVRRPPEEVLAEAQRAAVALKRVVDAKPRPVIINGERYLEFEDWMTLARFYGITAKVSEVRFVEYGTARGFEARAVALRSDGQEITAAESMCLDDEDRWKDRELFQLKSMAQTRAMAKALRNVLAWVVVLAGYQGTPAEEMTEGNGRTKAKAQVQEVRPDGVAKVASVVPGGEGKPTRVTLSDGRSGTTFDTKLVEKAQDVYKRNVPVTARFEDVQRAGRTFTNLMELAEAEAPPVPQAKPEQEPPIPEKVLTVREAHDPSGKVWFIIGGSEREYLTDSEDVAGAARATRALGTFVQVTYEWKAGRAGRWARVATAFTAPEGKAERDDHQ